MDGCNVLARAPALCGMLVHRSQKSLELYTCVGTIGMVTTAHSQVRPLEMFLQLT